MASSDPVRQLLRHTLATVAYRGCKILRNVPEGFGDFRVAPDARTPGEILAHVGDLFDWALSIAKGQQKWNDSTPLDWPQEVQRFYAALEAFDDYLRADEPLHSSCEKLFQGPIADALTHVGQLAMLRRLAAGPVRPENYYVAEIATGTVGADQPAPVREF
jgi:hypothetical protein